MPKALGFDLYLDETGNSKASVSNVSGGIAGSEPSRPGLRDGEDHVAAGLVAEPATAPGAYRWPRPLSLGPDVQGPLLVLDGP